MNDADSSGVCVSSVADGSILIPTDGTQSIVGTTADGVIGLFLQSTDVREAERARESMFLLVYQLLF